MFWETGIDVGAGTILTITVSPGTVDTYTTAWGVTADTIAGANVTTYGDGHKRIFITDSGAAQPSLLTTVAEVTTHLTSASGGGSDNDPVYLPALGLNLTDTGGNGWAELLGAIDSTGKYVVLDLSACTMGGTEFNPDGADMDAGRVAAKGKIVSLVLPTAATSIKAGTGSSDAAFNNFTALRVVTGTAILSVGDYAFYGCISLGGVNLLSATTIGDSAFEGCTNIVSVFTFHSYITIGDSAFEGCTSLSFVTLSSATTIGNLAFNGCTSLYEVSLPKATSIGNNAFQNTGTAGLTVTLGSAANPTAPELGTNMFSGVGSKPVTVKIPSGEIGYGASPTDTSTDCWSNGFRGGGWSNETMVNSTLVDSSISLTIEFQ